MAANAQVEEHVRQLASVLAGKDPRRIRAKARGTTLLMLTDDGGAVHRVRIEITKSSVHVAMGGAVPGEGDFAVVKGTVKDWLSFFNAAGPDTLEPLRLYGEVELLSTLGEILAASRSPIDIRAGGPR